MKVLTAIRERMLGWSCCQEGPQRNLCEGLEMQRSSMVEMETDPLERNGERQVVWPTRRSVGICPRKHGSVASCSKLWKLETVFEMWKEPRKDGPGCLGDPCASSMTGTTAGASWSTRERNVRWYRAGYGWMDSYGSGYGHRRGCGGIPEDVWLWLQGFDGSVASMASMVGAPMAPMVSMAWIDLMARELKRERESAVVWRAFVASHSPYQAFCFAFCSDALLVQCC